MGAVGGGEAVVVQLTSEQEGAAIRERLPKGARTNRAAREEAAGDGRQRRCAAAGP